MLCRLMRFDVSGKPRVPSFIPHPKQEVVATFGQNVQIHLKTL